ncbi:hypothetical protein J4Q44_G00311160 [Coregonus suidteri]|uniref:Uncharacterized protein n=1 Tax=Coregonus suidteri TaxID=861788 RepID=A0AAN8L3D7_9TELE
MYRTTRQDDRVEWRSESKIEVDFVPPHQTRSGHAGFFFFGLYMAVGNQHYGHYHNRLERRPQFIFQSPTWVDAPKTNEMGEAGLQ